MNNLATINKSDITITDTGEAYISHRKAAALCGAGATTLRDFFRAAEISITKGLSPDLLSKAAQHFALRGNQEAIILLTKISEAGAKAFLYHEAGYEMHAARVPTPLEAAEHQLEVAANLVKVIKENVILESQVNTLETDHDKSGDYISVKRMRELYPEKDISNKGLISASRELGLQPISYDGIYDAHCPALYHKDVWFMVYGIYV